MLEMEKREADLSCGLSTWPILLAGLSHQPNCFKQPGWAVAFGFTNHPALNSARQRLRLVGRRNRSDTSPCLPVIVVRDKRRRVDL